TDCKRNANSVSDLFHDLCKQVSTFTGSRNIIKNEVIGSILIIGPSEFDWISNIHYMFKLFPFNNSSVVDIEAWNDSFSFFPHDEQPPIMIRMSPFHRKVLFR